MKKPSLEEIQKNAERRVEDATRRFLAACELMNNDSYVEFYVKPNKEQAISSLTKALAEASKPAGTRSDAMVVELLREYQIFNEIATAASSLIEETEKSRRKAEEQALQKQLKA